ncbi:hypothetical protein [Hymenobacter lapidiphilus]|uniref:STAS/SEC14 domain-containing protein n=1 Tax=Hymenobacter lapidiphilus TaxID=2608003 RepID=A0A7Y7PMS0_9BACT|nr:hypothetical protein [Hymenobacter lapidiphilus]NVO30668.1 hypothetical protein [Hymenobacter lapidiphilus]
MSVADYVLISYRSDLRLLIMRWTRVATSTEHRSGYQEALRVAQPVQAGRWLIDLRSRGLADPADLVWILHDFRVELQAALPAAVRRIAYFTTPYHAELLIPRLQELNTVAAAELEIRVFVEEASAYSWLTG